MAKKSAAKMKVVDGDKTQTREEQIAALRKDFDEFKQGSTQILTQLIDVQDDRWDTFYQFQKAWRDMFGSNDPLPFTTAVNLSGQVKELHVKCRDIIGALTFEDLVSEGYEDPFADLVQESMPRTWNDVFQQQIRFSAVRPYGEKLESMRFHIMDNMPEDETADGEE